MNLLLVVLYKLGQGDMEETRGGTGGVPVVMVMIRSQVGYGIVRRQNI